MVRKRYKLEQDSSLPWQLETILWLIGLLCVPFGMWWFSNEITSPATMLGKVLKVPVNVQNFVEAFRPMILIFGLLIGLRVRCWLRRIVVQQLNRIV